MKKIFLLLSLPLLLLTSCNNNDSNIKTSDEYKKEFYKKYNEVKDVRSLFLQDTYIYQSYSHSYSIDDKVETLKNIDFKGYLDFVKKSNGFYIESNEFICNVEFAEYHNKMLENKIIKTSSCNGKDYFEKVSTTSSSTSSNNGYESNEVTYGSNEMIGTELLLDIDNIFFNLKKYDDNQLEEMYDYIKYDEYFISFEKSIPVKYGDIYCGNKRINTTYIFNENLVITKIKQSIDVTYDKTKYEVQYNNLQDISKVSEIRTIVYGDGSIDVDVCKIYDKKINEKYLNIDLT